MVYRGMAPVRAAEHVDRARIQEMQENYLAPAPAPPAPILVRCRRDWYSTMMMPKENTANHLAATTLCTGWIRG